MVSESIHFKIQYFYKLKTLCVNEAELVGYTVKNSAIVYTADSYFVLNGKKFQLRNAAGDAEGSINVTVQGLAADATVWFAGNKIGEVSNINVKIWEEGDHVTTGINNAVAAKALNAKFTENGKLVIVKNGVKYNAAGVQVK